ncbi:CdaR family transcriptional regulator [Latilactobacillus fuchuensis]|jgi:carbohydrate diacid regulator|uniref:Carbohydrate diacid regulator n=3 Tax=Latilactobacillus fuchuensis TaxID=164393 RepID=A0A2N9DUN7_9LACO|nr:sugar diacid recognition domain-containing protein [Latilactobacillus fuchuensis]KRL61474.1 hypothetical protein FC69_GL000691 [Latilactobacillus fuchuensis DSM 14340 = JCM 11249]MCP8857558.1 helix-turn-helix domain-containing protein [Latilactobacillus fuchuensis]SPC37926.1 conserved hypothetical protein [Latilactobacillus fuchuensis]
MEIEQQLAQKIVARLQREIPYNINVMNKQGVIIASGEPTRVGQLHDGAVEAIRLRQNNRILTDQPNGILQGFNMPIVVQNDVIGVVGITGDPEQLVYIAPLVKVTTELLTEQALRAKEEAREKRRLERFLLTWVGLTTESDQTADLINEAHALGINLNQQYQLILINTTILIHQPVDPNSYKIRLNPDELVIITRQPAVCQSWLALAQKQQYIVGISTAQSLLGIALAQARQVVDYNRLTRSTDPNYRLEIAHIQRLLAAKVDVSDYRQRLIEVNHQPAGHELIATLKMYIELNGNMQQTANQLHIHRNTLHYRLSQIKTKIGLDPKVYHELVMLYIALIDYQLN